MKRVLEDELISIAERILKLKNRADIHQLKNEAAELYEKLSILAFAESHFGGLKSEVSKTEFIEGFAEQFSDIDEESGHYKSPDGMDYNPNPISEPNTEKIKDIVSQMPPESEQVDLLLAEFEKLTHKSRSDSESHSENKKSSPSESSDEKKTSPPKKPYPTEDDFNSYGVHFDDLPDFEPKSADQDQKPKPPEQKYPEQNPDADHSEPKSTPPKPEAVKSNLNSAHEEKQSLNDRLKKGIKIGLNDRIAFTNHLFGGSTDDYNRVLSQLNTMSSFKEAESFIQNQVKPDYDNWEGKEATEARFMEIIERKFE
ncbi:hypothetical protein G3567_10070 [Psychroflexus sp. YR1-1]|uniref:Uncharacterized protein n=1 Tax=Psychroflexus aurantiacus TaxID=2709310 RepID=A0A6B3R5U2_9FLAO|nr:hypothetical protein [Psychroflexus aurantiacus]NEV94487.1 hypothetical protein [Psychroflexus aurantiacus]